MNIGIDIGGTKVRAGLVADGKVLKKSEIRHDFNVTSKQIIESIITLSNQLPDKRPKGIGIGVPGILSKDRSIWIRSPNQRRIKNLRLAAIISRELGIKAKVENDANAIALGELHYGVGRNEDNFVVITFGGGIGAGIIIDRKLYTGKASAGEIGHMTIVENGLKCACGGRGCWEEYASVKAVRRLAMKYFKKEMSAIELSALAEDGNRKALQLFSEMGNYLGIGMRNIANIFDPDVIVIAGGLSNTFKFMGKAAKQAMKDYCPETRLETSKVKDIEILGPESLLH